MKKTINVKLNFYEALEMLSSDDSIEGIIDNNNTSIIITIKNGKVCINNVETDLTVDSLKNDSWLTII